MVSIFRVMVGTAAVLAVSSALAQPATGPTLGAPVQSGEPATLPPDKLELIRKHAAQADLPTAKLGEPARVGMVLPRDVALLSLPRDADTVTPAVTSYSYIIAGDQIAIVDPATRKVIQVVNR